MHNFEHKNLIETLAELDAIPSESNAYSKWLEAEDFFAFLRSNALSDELVIYASSEYSFIHSAVVPNANLDPVDQPDLMSWNLSPFSTIASYVMGGGRDSVWIERGLKGTGTKTFEGALQLIYGRRFEGWSGKGRSYFEVHQEYSHLAEIHWRPEYRAYCRFDENGDIEPVVSISCCDEIDEEISLVSFKWEPLEEYLVSADASLVRMFDFTLYRRSSFSGWSDEPSEEVSESDLLFYRRKVMPGHASYFRGAQLIRRRRPEKVVFTGLSDGWFGRRERKHAEFIAYDWRNARIANISTDPEATTNYFDAEGNNLPFELSPAFFKPEVLLKYKTDRDKYTLGERHVACRAAWHMKGIDVNEAGQVHAYICYLRNIPYSEQLHWLSHNERPKASISERAFINDFKGEFVTFEEPLQNVLRILRGWHDEDVFWWALRDDRLFEHVNTPVTTSRDEWGEAFMDLAKLVIEGFVTKPIRARLDEEQVAFRKEDRTITLLEKLASNTYKSNDYQGLDGLRTVQNLRTKLKGHVGGRESEQLAQNAIMEHGSYGSHFQDVCRQVCDELEIIELLFSEESS